VLQASLIDKSRMRREFHVRFCERLRVKIPRSTRPYVESWFGGFKKEWLYRSVYKTESELRALVFEYIEVWYNRRRKHSALGYLSPMKFEKVNTAH
jgi:transposase InsO family protein